MSRLHLGTWAVVGIVIALGDAACTQPGGVIQADPAVLIQQPTAATHIASNGSLMIQWTYSGIPSPVWKLSIRNDYDVNADIKIPDALCSSSPCSTGRYIDLPAGSYLIEVKDESTGSGDMAAFVVDQ